MKRRSLLKAAAAGSGLALLPVSLRRALAMEAPAGGLDAVEHVVVFMQENRSFDHYFGTLRGVRGFNDPVAITLPDGGPVFRQPNGSGHLLPYRVGDEFMSGTPHGWADGHRAWNDGRHDQWVAQKGVRTMTHLDRAGLPFYHALADAFTVCDAYHCSEAGPTNPNRFYLFSGTIGYEPGTTKRAIGNDSWQNPGHTGYTWTSYAERLQQAGRSWRVYQEWDNYGDNSLDYFASFLAVGRKALAATKDSAGKAYAKLEYFYYDVASASAARREELLAQLDKGVAALSAADRSLYDRGLARQRTGELASVFRADVAAGRLPAVSWVVAPESQSEHPDWGPNTGAELVKRVLDAIAANPEVWRKTVFLLNYDENDGFFDHVPQPAPPVSPSQGLSTAAVADEIYDGWPIGLGQRVPLLVVSPWSRGGKVCSEVFDHTSVLRLLERWTGVAEPNISPWRRAVCGDLTSALDLSGTGTCPALPAPVPTSGPRPTSPTPPGAQVMPVQEPGVRPARPLPYVLSVSGRVTAEKFWVDFTSSGEAGAHFSVYANAFRTDGPWRYTVGAGRTLTDYWQAGTPTGSYDLTVLGPNGFLRRFAGDRVVATSGGANPEVTMRYAPADGLVWLAMTNSGKAACTLTVRVGNRAGGPWTYTAGPGATVEDWFSVGRTSGWYDLTASGPDGFVRRFAGHVENGAESTSDPVMGSGTLAGTSTASAGEVRVDVGQARTVTAVPCRPRQAGPYEVHVSTDGSSWGSAVASGTFTGTAATTVRLWPATARYVRVRAAVDGVTASGW